jgi:hypothetical protein
VVGAPVWPSGVTLAAEADFMVTAVAASTVAPRNTVRRSNPFALASVGCGKWGSVVVIFSSQVFVWKEIVCPQLGIKRARSGGTT